MNRRGEVFRSMGRQHADETLPYLSSLQLTDSFFPSGLYTLSHGLEAYVQADLLPPSDLESLVTDLLRFSVGPADSVALVCAHRAVRADDLGLAMAADQRLTAVKLVQEVRLASQRTGRQLLHLAGEIFGGSLVTAYGDCVGRGEAPGNHAVALGLTMGTLGLSEDQAIVGELYSFTSSCVGAMLRLGRIDHRIAQTVLHHLRPVIVEVAQSSKSKGVLDIAGCAPLAEIMSMHHEQADIRLFST